YTYRSRLLHVSRYTPYSPLFLFFSLFSLHRQLHSFPTRRSSDLINTLQVASVSLKKDCNLLNLNSKRSKIAKTTSKIMFPQQMRSEEHTSELQSRFDLVCRLLLEKKNNVLTLRKVKTPHDSYDAN